MFSKSKDKNFKKIVSLFQCDEDLYEEKYLLDELATAYSWMAIILQEKEVQIEYTFSN